VDFSLTQEQTLIRDSALRFVADEYGFAARTALAQSTDGFSREHWKTFAELGWLGIGLPEERGGFGGTPVETMLLMEAFGTGLVLEPFVASVVLGGGALAHGASSSEHFDLLRAMVEGDVLLTLAYAEPDGRFDPAAVVTRARSDGADLVITGKKVAVPFGAAADHFVVSLRTGDSNGDSKGIALAVIDARSGGIARNDYTTIDGLRASDITFDGVRVPRAALLDAPGLELLERVLDDGIAAICAEAVGVMATMQRVTVDYLKTRKQFGVSIGSFQALQHRAVDMLIQLELARSMEIFAAMMLRSAGSTAERRRALSAAKVQVSRSGRYVGQQAIQLHGAIGMTDEYMVGHYFKRMSAIELSFGDVDYHLKRYVALTDARPRVDLPSAGMTQTAEIL
jgi:alkylation response protein AidB-like acyl-CoA dehydrogenase